MMWLHHTPEWFDAEPNPGNCSVRLIEGERSNYVDRGYVVGGTKSMHLQAEKEYLQEPHQELRIRP